MRILILAAHPDDEVLGCGGSIARWNDEGHQVYVHVLSEGTTAQYDAKEIRTKRDASERIKDILGIREIFHDDLPDAKLDTIPVLSIAKCIEKRLDEIKPDIVFTQHIGDISQDHKAVNEATMIVGRPTPDNPIKRILSYEVPSGTEWGAILKNDLIFKPNYFIDIEDYLQKKIDAMKEYQIELRDYPHPRSIKGIENLASYRGQMVGLNYAEAFEISYWKY